MISIFLFQTENLQNYLQNKPEYANIFETPTTAKKTNRPPKSKAQ